MKNFLVRHRGAFRIIQHLMAALIATGVVFCFAGSGIMVSGADGEYSYNLYESDSNRSFEDSYLFNNILGNDLSDVIKLVAIRSQLETKGIYDGDKKIDVTAYVNRKSVITGDYVTAVYKISDSKLPATNKIATKHENPKIPAISNCCAASTPKRPMPG